MEDWTYEGPSLLQLMVGVWNLCDLCLWTWGGLVNESFKQTKHKLASMLTRGTLDYLWTRELLANKRITWSWRIMSFLNTKAFLDFHSSFRISIFHLDVLLGIIFGQFNFLIDLEFEIDERIWFFGLMNHWSL